MSDNFYFNTDQNKYIPIKTNLNILHKNDIDTSNKSDNKIGLVYNTDTSNYELKSIPKHMKIIKDLNDIYNTSEYMESVSENIPFSKSVSSYTSNTNSNPFKQSSKSINESVSSYTSNPFKQSNKSINESVSSYTNSNPFKQSSKQIHENINLNTNALNDINNSLDIVNMQIISICNKKKKLSNAYKNLINSKIIKILNRCN